MASTKHAAAASSSLPVNIGGQAVIDGVMMRAPGFVATAVRVDEDRIVVRRQEFHSLARRYPILGVPVLRGALSLVESLILGTRTLNWSAEISQYGADSQAEHDLGHRVMAAISLLLALAVGVLLFMYLPYLASTLLGQGDNQIFFHLLVGFIRVSLLLAYLWAISRWSEVRTLFAYHGAEHKSIYAWEETRQVTVEEALRHTRFHPRCGTSFLLVVALATVLVYAVFDSLWIQAYGPFSSVLHRLLVHLPIIPLVAGVSFELLQLSNRGRGHGLIQLLIAPGLWFQRLTTREPDAPQIEVAVVAIRASLNLPMDGLNSRIDFV
ncbi:MAG: DUF1385 domain-containing protein [bacterium]|nr:DUF1385 domain-containing protein [bacterium]